jgi:hypothetical protein
MGKKINGPGSMLGEFLNEDPGKTRERHTVDGSTDGFFNGSDGAFNLRNMGIRGADREVNRRETGLKWGEFAIGVNISNREATGPVE